MLQPTLPTRVLPWVLGAIWALALAPSALAEPPDPNPDALRELESRKAVLAAEIEEAASLADDPAAEQLQDLRVRIDHVLEQHLDELRRAEDLRRQVAEADRGDEKPASDDLGDPPYGLEIHDRASAELDRYAQETGQLTGAVETARAALDSAREEQDRLERQRRAAKEGGLPELQRLELEVRLSASVAGLRKTALDNARTSLALLQRKESRAVAVYDWVASNLAVSPGEVPKLLEPYDREEAALRRRLERAELDLEAAKSRWSAAQKRIQRGAAEAPPSEELDLLRSRLSLRQKDVALLGAELDRLAATRERFRRRLALLGPSGPERSQLVEWLAATQAALQELDRERSLDVAEITALEQEAQELDKKVSLPGASDLLRARAETLRARLGLHRRYLDSLDASRDVARRLQADLERSVGTRSLRDRANGLVAALSAAWTYEIFASGESPITLGKLTTAVFLIVTGFLLAGWLARQAERRLLPRFGLDSGASHAFSSLGFYVLLVAITLLSLHTVRIPLTAFAILGGAVAIGVGFGSQNVVNNFISGIILLAERPIKIGDLIQVEDTYGNVERIGLRSTRIRTGQNIHYIVPNSTFLESRVINWTHNDSIVRIKLEVGVVYGSPTRKVEELLRRALQEHGRVLRNPTPIILFNGFGESSLDFQAHFWVGVRSLMDRLTIESDLRFEVDALFREAGLVIAFPQRDVHLDTAAPLQIHVVGSAPSEPSV